MDEEDSMTVAGAAGQLMLGGRYPLRRIGYGSMQLTGTGTWGMPADPDAAIGVLRLVVELGVQFIDTADSRDIIGSAPARERGRSGSTSDAGRDRSARHPDLSARPTSGSKRLQDNRLRINGS